MQQANAGKDSVLLDPVVAPRIAAARLLIGLLQGITLYFLSSAMLGKTWPASDPYVLGPLLLMSVILPVLLISSLGHMAARRIALWMASAAVIMVMLAVHDIWRSGGLEPWSVYRNTGPMSVLSGLLIVFSIAGFFIAHTLVLAGGLDQRRIATYPTHFETAWKLGIQLLFSAFFVGVLWLVLWMGAQLFLLIKLNFLKELIGHSWFVIPVTCFAFSCAIHITDVRPAIVRGIRTLLLVLMSWLLPVTALLVAGFLLSLPFTGIEKLWATRRATSVLLGTAAVLVLLINAAFQNGQVGQGVARVIKLSTRLAALLLPLVVGIAIYALAVRVIEYGWTSDRIIACACLVVATCYALGYAWAARQNSSWLSQIAEVNVATAFVVLAVLFALFSPLADPARLAVASQMARFEAGKTSLDKFDFAYLRFEGARYGRAALEQLKVRSSGADAALVRAGADAILKRASRWSDEVRLKNVAFNLTVRPATAQLPDSFLRQDWSVPKQTWYLPDCMKQVGKHCDAYPLDFNGDGKPEVLLVSSEPGSEALLLMEKADGSWQAYGHINSSLLRCKPLREQLRAGDFRLVAPRLKELEIGGKRLRLSLLSDVNDADDAEKCVKDDHDADSAAP
ncbi:DUF4153 domain-containing protein [Janthinobacterium agaricidamnosum]|uniref:Putative membrane protein n=1 Tax=Janthinobacterium agaricidamnosum NBRC 102515 = DSM 9628 TaxID=1349767 RepID=W0V9B0_9BURK|nr:DUF4153 domain-containing protein [Janthinobacterium agaricidamnosum]CDG83877.1 putative membrane protein [Janthinobacterium agaricidamnosum NBRC 102515 = DSM 9628]